MLVERDLARKSRKTLSELVAKAESYRDSDIEGQTRDKNLQILSDIDAILYLTGSDRPSWFARINYSGDSGRAVRRDETPLHADVASSGTHQPALLLTA